MPAAELTPDAPFARRFVAYLGERFPLPAYTVLIGALVAGAVATAEGAAGGAAPLAVGWRHLGAFATALLLFFHLRVFDEFKDFAADQLAHPERLLSRGVITLRALGWAGVVVLALQLGINVGLGLWALAWWGAAVAFSVLMRFEFFVGDWLRRHLVAYALLHNPIVAWLMLYVDAVHRGTRPFSPLALGFVAVFAGATNTPLACTIMAIELFAPANTSLLSSGFVVYAAIACFLSWFLSGHSSIYRAQRIGGV